MIRCQECGKTIGYLGNICGDCAQAAAIAAQQQEAAISLWAAMGITDLEHYLSGWAAFAEWETARHPPV